MRHSIWRIVGLAGLAGVAATGVVVVRAERQRRSYSSEEVRARLHDRVANLQTSPVPADTGRPRRMGKHVGLARRRGGPRRPRAGRRRG